MVVAPAKKIDITQHVLVPSHQKLSPEETTEVLEKFNISLTQLPSILSNDSIAKALGAKAGEVIKIERQGPLSSSQYFRRVIE